MFAKKGSRNFPPTPFRPLPLVGHLPHFARDPLRFLERAMEASGDIYTLNLGTVEMILLNHPDHSSHMLIDRAENYGRGAALYGGLRTLLGDDLITMDGDPWLRRRRRAQPHFHKQRHADFAQLMVGVVEENLGIWARKAAEGPVDIVGPVNALTAQIIVRTLLGSDLALDEITQVESDLAFVVDYQLPNLLISKLPRWVPFPSKKRYQHALHRVDQTILATIRRREAGGAARGDDLLATLLKPIDETDPTMSRRDLRDEVVGMFLAGYETTATTLAWTLHLLARYPDIQARARDEVDRVLVSRTPGLSDLPQLGYLSCVLQETQRYRPVSWMIPRTAAEDDDIGGFRIPAGAIVASCTYGSHHNRSIWNDPGTFDPDRFLPGRLSEAQARAWVPFGLGQHLCVGRDFAVLEMHIVLSMILQRFTWFEIPERPVGVQVRATIKPKGGVWVTMRDRNG